MTKKLIVVFTALLAIFCCINLSVYAEDLSLTQDAPRGEMEVTANVLAPDAPSYVVTIPAKVDFGPLKQPEGVGVSYKEINNINIKASDFRNIGTGQGVVVLAKGSGPSASFTLTNQTKPNINLNYEFLDSGGNNITSNKLYDNGYYVFTFGQADKINTKMQLDQQQLYNQKLENYAGTYSGKITFYTKVVNVADYK